MEALNPLFFCVYIELTAKGGKMDNEGEIFKKRALDAERLLDIAIRFIESKGLYNAYMKFKETS